MNEETTPTTPPASPGRAGMIRRLTRSSEGRVVAGVARGLSDYTGMDPVVFRIGFIVLTVAGGAGILAYLLAWVVIPLDDSSTAPGEAMIRRLRGSRLLAALFIGTALAIFVTAYTNFGSPVILALALIAVGVVMLRDEPLPTISENKEEQRVGALGAPQVATKRPRSPLGLYTLGTALLVVGIAAALVGGGAISLELGQYFGLGLAVIGGGLVVGGWWGRSRLLILAALLLIPLMLVASVIHVPLKGRLGDQYILSRNNLADHFDVLAGSMTLDLSRYRFGETPDVVDVNMALGHLRVYVPPGVSVTVDGSIDAGATNIFGESDNGFDVAFGGRYQRAGSTEGDLVVNVRGGLSKVTMTWASWVEQEIRYRERRRERRLEKKRAERAQEQRKAQPNRRNRGD